MNFFKVGDVVASYRAGPDNPVAFGRIVGEFRMTPVVSWFYPFKSSTPSPHHESQLQFPRPDEILDLLAAATMEDSPL